MKIKKDVKFVIYQVLYIFVVCVIALKGANLDLAEVMAKDDVVKKDVVDSMKKYIDSLLKLGYTPTGFTKVLNADSLKNIIDNMKSNLASNITSTGFTIDGSKMIVDNGYDVKREDLNETPNSINTESEQRIEPVKVQTIYQFRNNSVYNQGNLDLTVSGDGKTLAVIPPKSSKTFLVEGQSNISFKMGDRTASTVSVPNKLQAVSMQRLAPSGEGVSLKAIQSSVGYRITIDDDFPDQLEVKFTGPVIVKQNGNTYDVTLNFMTSKSQFDKYTENLDSPYSVSFNIMVTDKISKKVVSRQGVFQFSEY